MILEARRFARRVELGKKNLGELIQSGYRS